MRVSVTAALPGTSLTRLGASHDVSVFAPERTPTPAELLELTRGSDAIVSMVADRVTEGLMDASPGLRIVANCGVGYENIDLEAATTRGIYVTNTPGVLTDATADLAWALMLAVARRVPEGDAFTRSGRFAGWLPTLLLGAGVYGKTLGIFGMGKIGTAVATRARGFSMRVIYHNRTPAPEGESETGAQYVGFDELLANSDFIVITAPLNEGTLGRFGTAEFERMKPGAVLVNLGRGQIVRESELIAALERGEIRGAGLDVFEREPSVEQGLLSLPNTVLLPHLGSATNETRELMAEMAVSGVERVLGGGVPPNVVNRDLLEGP